MKTKTIFLALTAGVILISGVLAITGNITGGEFITSVGTSGGILFGLYQQYSKNEIKHMLNEKINDRDNIIEKLHIENQIINSKFKLINESKESPTKPNKRSRKQ